MTSNSVPIAVYYRDPSQSQAQSNSGPANWRNQPQSNAMAAGSLIFCAGGMSMALGLGWNLNTDIVTTLHFQFCWFIGVIAGAIVAAPLITFVPKRIYLLISALLVLASGIIFTSVPTNYDAIIAARYINGIAIGFATVPFLVLASEVAAKSYRGSCLSVEQYGMSLGIVIQVVYASQWTYDIDFYANRVHGIFIIVFAVVSLASVFMIIESPIYYIRKGDDAEALECLRRLTRPQVVTNDTKARLEEDKNYVLFNENLTFMGSFIKGIIPLMKMMLYRGVLAFCFALPMNGALEVSSLVSMGYPASWPPIVYGVLRLFGVFIAMFLIDGLGRKLVPLFALIVIAGLTLGIGGIFSDWLNLFSEHQMSVVVTLSLLTQFFVGFFVPSASTYLGEAFPMLVKPYFIAISVIVEQVVHIIVIVTFVFSTYNMYVYSISAGVIMAVLFLVFCVTMPETRNISLKEAQERMKRLLNLKCY